MATMAAVPPLPDELLEVIFLRLGSVEDLARVPAVCASFRHLVRGRRFLRRFRSLHGWPVLCLLGNTGFHPAEPPHSSAPAGRDLAWAADLSFSFLPKDPLRSWSVRDARDGRVLLSRRATTDDAIADRLLPRRVAPDDAFADLVVCDPLHRRYVQIPAISEDIVSIRRCDGMKFQPLIAPACKDEEDRSFRVLYNVVSLYKVVTFDFSSVTGKWRHATSFSFLPERFILNPPRLDRYCVRGCFFWANHREPYMLVLDPVEMKFSLLKVLHNRADRGRAVVDAGEDGLGLLTTRNLGLKSKLGLYCKTWRNNVVCTEDWQHHKTIPLPDHYCSWEFKGDAEGYLLMFASQPYLVLPKAHYFTLDLRTLLIERMHVLDKFVSLAHLYASFPPALSPPSI